MRNHSIWLSATVLASHGADSLRRRQRKHRRPRLRTRPGRGRNHRDGAAAIRKPNDHTDIRVSTDRERSRQQRRDHCGPASVQHAKRHGRQLPAKVWKFNIRGIGKAEHNTQTTTGVITYRDGVATFPGYFQEEPYFDIASVQVLRGPQGTIAGQNSTGAQCSSIRPIPSSTGGYHGYIQAQYGNYNDLAGQGAINIPVSDTFAARVAFYGDRRDSFIPHQRSGRIQVPLQSRRSASRGTSSELALEAERQSIRVSQRSIADRLDMGGYPADPYTDRFQDPPRYGRRPIQASPILSTSPWMRRKPRSTASFGPRSRSTTNSTAA